MGKGTIVTTVNVGVKVGGNGVKVAVGGGGNVGVLVKVDRDVGVGVELGGGMNGVLLGDGVVLMVGVGVIVGLLVFVPVNVIVGVWLGVVEPVGKSAVKVMVEVRVAKTTGVQDDVEVDVPEICPPLPGARSAATAPTK